MEIIWIMKKRYESMMMEQLAIRGMVYTHPVNFLHKIHHFLRNGMIFAERERERERERARLSKIFFKDFSTPASLSLCNAAVFFVPGSTWGAQRLLSKSKNYMPMR